MSWMRLGSLQMIALAAALSFGAGTAVGAKFLGYERGAREARKEAQTRYDVLYQTSLRLVAEREQCREQVARFNAATEQQRVQSRAIEQADRAARAEAVGRAEAAAAKAAEDAARVQLKIEEGADALQKLADSCVAAGVPAGFVDVLNGVIAAGSRAADNRDRPVPGGAPGD
jgi:hypothetical protein